MRPIQHLRWVTLEIEVLAYVTPVYEVTAVTSVDLVQHYALRLVQTQGDLKTLTSHTPRDQPPKYQLHFRQSATSADKGVPETHDVHAQRRDSNGKHFLPENPAPDTEFCYDNIIRMQVVIFDTATELAIASTEVNTDVLEPSKDMSNSCASGSSLLRFFYLLGK